MCWVKTASSSSSCHSTAEVRVPLPKGRRSFSGCFQTSVPGRVCWLIQLRGFSDDFTENEWLASVRWPSASMDWGQILQKWLRAASPSGAHGCGWDWLGHLPCRQQSWLVAREHGQISSVKREERVQRAALQVLAQAGPRVLVFQGGVAQ